jgi:hypothetical protein
MSTRLERYRLYAPRILDQLLEADIAIVSVDLFHRKSGQNKRSAGLALGAILKNRRDIWRAIEVLKRLRATNPEIPKVQFKVSSKKIDLV